MRPAAAIACVIAVVSLGVCPASAEPQPREPGGTRLLDVPFVPQSEALCGGAAVAMVLRYWQPDAAVYAEDFAPLVNESAEGIAIGDLSRAVRARGWQAWPLEGSAAELERHLGEGRPVIALVEDRPGRYHYVVVVAWTRGRIVFHDPARKPFRVVDEAAFDRTWARTGRTALLVMPDSPAAGSEPPASPDADGARADACQAPVDRVVAYARAGELDEAERLLAFVSDACPGFSGGPRELAGIRFLQKRWADAAALAADATARDPADRHAWQLRAASEYLAGDPMRALAAWNRREEPRVDLARIGGLDRTPYEVVYGALDLPPHTLLTDRDLRRASNRIAELPSILASRVSYLPTADGRADVEVAIAERPLAPIEWPGLGAMGAHAAIAREARMDIASPTGNGELWTLTGRWWNERPRVGISLAAPRLGPWRALWRIDGAWERQTYTARVSERRRASVSVADWATDRVRWELTTAFDQWSDRGVQPSAGVAIERRLLDDRLSLRAEGAAWLGRGDAAGFGTANLTSTWRVPDRGSASWAVDAGAHVVGRDAPLDLWQAAGTGIARTPLLRAHALLHDGAIRTADLGRLLVHATVERRQRLAATPWGEIGVAGFVDAARVAWRDDGSAGPLQVDAGAGLRLRLPGAPGILRLDLARGFRDGRLALSAGWTK